MLVSDCIAAAYRTLGIIQPGEIPSNQENADGLLALNSMISSWNTGIQKSLAGSYVGSLFTFVPLATYSAVTVNLVVADPAWERAYVFSLAQEMSFQFGRPVGPELAAMVAQSKAAVLTLPAPVI